MSSAVTEPLRIFALTTAFALSWVVPMLLAGKTASRAASPSGVQPSTATTSAADDSAVDSGPDMPLFLLVGRPVGSVSLAVERKASRRGDRPSVSPPRPRAALVLPLPRRAAALVAGRP